MKEPLVHRIKKGFFLPLKNKLEEPLSADIDENIRKIRERLSPKYNQTDREFNFYTDLRRNESTKESPGSWTP
jgi:hypothetical protein